MNKDTIQLDKNTYAVTDEHGNARIVSTINSSNQETMKKILLKENDIEEIEEKLTKYKKDLKLIKSNTLYAKVLNALIWVMLITFGIVFQPTNIEQWLVLGTWEITSYTFVKTISYGIFGSKKQRNQTKKQIEEEIPNLEQLLESTNVELEQLKNESIFTELTNLNNKTTNGPNYNYVYTYDPNNCNLDNVPKDESNKEVHVMKLSKIKRNPFQQKDNL